VVGFRVGTGRLPRLSDPLSVAAAAFKPSLALNHLGKWPARWAYPWVG